MATRLSDIEMDNKKWECAAAFVRAYAELQYAIKTYGPYSKEADASLKVAEYRMVELKKIALK